MSKMNESHTPSMGLNLIVALDALLTERNVTRAAMRIGVTQSAMSHSLAQLRALLGDPLLVRSKKDMVPTPRAEVLGAPVKKALADLALALASPAAFVPALAQMQITIATSDYGEIVMLPRIVARLLKEAPGIDLRVRAEEGQIVERLAEGTVDLGLRPPLTSGSNSGVFAKKLFTETFVCVMRKTHPLAKKKKLKLDDYANALHTLISMHGSDRGVLDDALARVGRQRRIAVVVPHFLVAPYVVASADLLLTLPERIARRLEKSLDLTVKPLPAELDVDGFIVSALWHERTQHDAAHKWFRGVVDEVAKAT
jgi:DNA-binding transcriptional LysR family regulator